MSGRVPSEFPGPDRFTVLFAGNMGKAQALDAVLEAAHLLQERDSRVSFVMLGGGVEVTRLKAKATRLDLRNVVFLPPVPMAEVGALLGAADVLLVHLRNDPLFEVTIPSKTQAYMAAGKPLLLAVKGDAADLVRRADAGVLAEPENAVALATAADSLAQLSHQQLQAMGRRAREYYDEHLSIRRGTASFAAIFGQLAPDGGTP